MAAERAPENVRPAKRPKLLPAVQNHRRNQKERHHDFPVGGQHQRRRGAAADHDGGQRSEENPGDDDQHGKARRGDFSPILIVSAFL